MQVEVCGSCQLEERSGRRSTQFCGKGTAAVPRVGAAAGVTAAAVGLHEEATGGGCESGRRTARCAGCWRDVMVLRCDGVYTRDTITGDRRNTAGLNGHNGPVD